MDSETPTPPEKSSLKQWFLLWGELLPLAFVVSGFCVYSAYIWAPVHWRFVKHHGPNFLWLQLLFLVIWTVVWTRVPSIPELVQGVVCIVGWMCIVGAVLGWIPFALGVLVGFNGF